MMMSRWTARVTMDFEVVAETRRDAEAKAAALPFGRVVCVQVKKKVAK
jgi:hypothetical protein